MRRFVVLTLLAVFSSSAAFADESLAQVASRVMQSQLAASDKNAMAARPVLPARALRAPETAAGQDPAVLSRSGLRRRTKVMLFASLAAGFVASAWAIDRNVQDITPSSLGTRQD